MQDRACYRLFLAQGRQGGLGGLARGAGRAGGALCPGLVDQPFAHARLGRLHRLVRFAEAAPQKLPLGHAQRLADLAVAGSLPGLPGQSGDLFRQRAEHVIHPRQVRLGRRQSQLRLVPPGVKPRNPCGFFQDAASGTRLGRDQFGDLALPHQCRRMRPGRGIGEQHLHVPRPHLLAVGAKGRSGIAGDPAHDLDLIGLVETRGGKAFGIVDDNGHFGIAAGGARGGACEDHVLHPAAAHGRGTVLAHHPAQRLQQVRLAAAVRPHDAGQTVVDDEVRGVHEALETVEAKAGESHGCPAAGARIVGRHAVGVNRLPPYLD